MTAENGVYEVLWPRGRRTAKSVSLSRRHETLEGKTICELSNRIFHTDETFLIIEQELAKRYHGIKFVSYEAFGNTHGREEAKLVASLPGLLKQNRCDAVISGNGC